MDVFRAREILTWLLARLPVCVGTRQAKVRIRCWSDILAYIEIFRVGVYDKVFDESRVETYCDLGCQSGYAMLRLISRSGRPRQSVLVDGNPNAIERCSENLRRIGSEGIRVVHGAVGVARQPGETTTQFTLRPNELECSLEVIKDGDSAAKTVTIPAIDLERLWVENVGDVSCDLLKMDIEGAEVGVLSNDRPFLERVQRCVLEWHDPPVSREAIIRLLHDQGFGDIEVLCHGERSGLLSCRRKSHAQPKSL